MVHDRHRATPLGEQHHAFAHRTSGKQGRQVLREHHVGDAQQQVPPSVPPG